jgi:hypothetical protein
MSTGPKAGLEAAGGTHAVREAAEIRQAEAEGEQLDLIEAERLDAQLPIAPSDAARKGPGRPKGAKNKRTEALAAYYMRRHGDPLEALLVMGMGSIEHTAREMHGAVQALKADGVKIAHDAKGREMSGIDINELVKLKMRCLEAALPYLHARRAPIDGDGEAVVPVLNIGVGVHTAGDRAGGKGAGGIDIEAAIGGYGTVAPQGFADDDDEGVA